MKTLLNAVVLAALAITLGGCERMLDWILDDDDSDRPTVGIVVNCEEFAEWSWQDSLPTNTAVGPSGWIPDSYLSDSTVYVYRFTRRNPDGSVSYEDKWYFATANDRWYGKPGDSFSIWSSGIWFPARNFVVLHSVSLDSAVARGCRQFIAENEGIILWESDDWISGHHTFGVSLYCPLRPARQMRAEMPLLDILDALSARPDLCVIAWSSYAPYIHSRPAAGG